MTDAKCATGCGRPSPSAALCTPCTTSLRSSLELAASIAPDLDDAVARQLRHGGNGKRSDAEPPLPFDPRASAAAEALRLVLMETAAKLMKPGARWTLGWYITPIAGWLAPRVTLIARHPDALDMWCDTRDAVAQAVAVLEPPAELHPAGQCESCGRRLLAEAGADQADCRCGWVTTGLNAAKLARADAAEVLGTAAEISGALKAMKISVPRGTITSWASRGRLTPKPGERDGAAVYALSDVLALISERDNRVRG